MAAAPQSENEKSIGTSRSQSSTSSSSSMLVPCMVPSRKKTSKRDQSPKKTQDRSQIIGPYDFREEAFNDRATILDYTNLMALMAFLPVSLSNTIAWRQLRWMTGFHLRQSWREALWQTIMDHFSNHCSWRQLRVLSPVRPLRVELNMFKHPKLPGYNDYFGGRDYSARWLCEVPNRRPEDPVILYLHGGSYALKVQKPQLSYMASLTKMLETFRVSVLILDYTIGPFAKHPTQLNEALACYKDLQKSCNNMIVLGDSCGGHLALAMLLSGAKFSGLVLISPSTDMTSNEPEDVSMREVFVDTTKYELTNPLISPLYADPSIWPKILPERTAIEWGGSEMCRPQMIEWARLAGVKSSFEEPGGSHDCILRGTKNPGSRFIQTQLARWLQEDSTKNPKPTE